MNDSLIKNIRKVFRPLKRFYNQHKARRKAINHFKKHLRPTDIFLVGHPKSGNTWLTLMLGILIEKNFSKNITLGNIQEFIPSFHARDGTIKLYGHFPDPRIFRNERPIYPELLPKTIYIVRDPRSAYVSYYHHCLHDNYIFNRGSLEWKFEDFVEEMLTYGCIRSVGAYMIRWDKQVSQWLERSKNQPVKIVKYEDMKMDRRKVLEDVVEFAGIPCSEEDIDMAFERSSFNNMRKEEETYGATPYSGTRGEGGYYYVRQGKTDGWKDEMSQDIVKRIEREFCETMKKVGYL